MKYVANHNKEKPDNTEILYPDVKIENGLYYAIKYMANDKTYVNIPMGNAVILTAKMVNLNDYSQYFELSFTDSSGAKYEGLLVARETASDKKKILELTKHGIITDEKKAVYLSHSLLNQELELKERTK